MNCHKSNNSSSTEEIEPRDGNLNEVKELERPRIKFRTCLRSKSEIKEEKWDREEH